jgi:hypothetical protein
MEEGMTKFIRAFLLVSVVCGLSAFIAWCGGFNFDERTPAVAMWILLTLGFCIPVAGIVGVIE